MVLTFLLNSFWLKCKRIHEVLYFLNKNWVFSLFFTTFFLICFLILQNLKLLLIFNCWYFFLIETKSCIWQFRKSYALLFKNINVKIISRINNLWSKHLLNFQLTLSILKSNPNKLNWFLCKVLASLIPVDIFQV